MKEKKDELIKQQQEGQGIPCMDMPLGMESTVVVAAAAAAGVL